MMYVQPMSEKRGCCIANVIAKPRTPTEKSTLTQFWVMTPNDAAIATAPKASRSRFRTLWRRRLLVVWRTT